MPRDMLRELGWLVREGDVLNVDNFVCEHAAELAPLLGTTAENLHQGLERPELVGRLRGQLERVLDARRQRRRDDAAAIAERAAVAVGASARFFEHGVVLDIDLVLGELLADPTRKHVAFMLPENIVVVEAALLRRARLLRRTFMDAVCFIDEEGIHFRWKAGRGRLNLTSQPIPQSEMHRALAVHIPPPMRSPMPAQVGLNA